MAETNDNKWTRKTKSKSLPKAQSDALPKGQQSEYYRVYLSDKRAGVEFGEHALSRQLFVVFESLPEINLAGKLEAMGFDRTEDERIQTCDADDTIRQKAFKAIQEYIEWTKSPKL